MNSEISTSLSTTLSFADRERAIHQMQAEVFDLAIIGGGITGAGIARDAASRGMRVALIEARDFASGTSSRSSKLIHGGIRYLENLEFGLVFEALSERQRLFEMAPHLVHPLRFVLPVYKGGRVPAWKLGLGMWAYDALSLFEAPELNDFLDVRDLERELPSLRTQQLEGAFAYYDAYMDDDRLVLETLRAAGRLGVPMANYVEATGVMFGLRVENLKDPITLVECRDVKTGNAFRLNARHVISSVGPWTDILGQKFFNPWKKTLRPSKGTHLTFHNSRFPIHDAVVMAAENRIVFAIPRHEMVIVGTTDTDYPGDPAQVRADVQDVDYIMRVVGHYFPGAGLTRDDILGCYAGVRPLIDDGAATESKTSREHEIWTDPRGVTFVAGGKYTTYRNMAEQTVDHALGHFSIEDRVKFNRSHTLEPLNPLVSEILLERAINESDTWSTTWGLNRKAARQLADRHGMEGKSIARRAAFELPIAITSEEWVWGAEAMHAVEQTMCLSLTDFYFRRTPLVLSRHDHGLPMARSIASVMGHMLNWDSQRQSEEINALQNQLAKDLGALSS